MNTEKDIRAEEIIAEVYRQLTYFKESRPKRILMHPSLWDRVRQYRRTLGEITGPVPDYLSDDTMFGLEIWYDNQQGIKVE